MANIESDDMSLPLLPPIPPEDETVEIPTENTLEYCTAVNADTETSVSSITAVSTTDGTTSASPLKHPCYAILNGGRRKQLENMPFRIKLIETILELSPSLYLPSMLSNEFKIKSWTRRYTAYMKNPRKWNRAIMAQALCGFDLIMTEARALVATSSDSLIPPPITEFETYMNNVRAVNEIVENEPTKKGKIGNQLAGKRIQDSIPMSEITRSKLDFSNCANCHHNFVLPIGPEQNEINHHNDEIKRVYRDKMFEYNHRSRSRKGSTKPKMGKCLSRKLACLCCRMHCLNRPDGVGCLKCEWACIEQSKSRKPGEKRAHFDDNSDCKCKICACQCSVVYFRSEEKRLAEQSKRDMLEALDTKPQSKINGFFGFTNAIADLANERLAIDPTLTSSDLLGLTSEDLLTSIELQQDVDLRNTLQKSVGAVQHHQLKSDGKVKSLAELRREARLKRFVNPHKANSHKTVDVDTISIVTPVKFVGNNDNNRWYRNKLSKVPVSVDSVSSHASSGTAASNMHKAVMKRLLQNNSSPTTLNKRKCFRKMAAGDNEANTIIDLSLEMGSTVDEVTKMILDNCNDTE